MTTRVLVTGGAGFVGSHLCESLLGVGYHVTALDNLSTGNRQNLARCLANDRFRFIERNVCEPLPDSLKFDEIYNLACPASPLQYQRSPTDTLRTSVLGAMNVLDYAKRHGSRALLASTSEVYGDPEVHPQTEDYPGSVRLDSLRSCYDEGKRCAETLFYDYAREHGVETRVVRIFNTYGPRLDTDDGRVVSNFIVRALRGDALEVYGDGSQTRSFMYVDDLVRGIRRCMASDISQPVNLGNPDERTILEFAETVLAATHSRSRIEFLPAPDGDPQRRRPDITRARNCLGWAPTVSLEAGLRSTVSWFEERLKRPRRSGFHTSNVAEPLAFGTGS